MLLLQGLAYFNLMVSEKYETQPEGLTEIKTQGSEQVEKRAAEIQKQKKKTVIYSIVLFVVLVVLIVMWSRHKTCNNRDRTLHESVEKIN